MAFGRHRRLSASDQEKRDREIEAWLDRALGARGPDPEPDVHDV